MCESVVDMKDCNGEVLTQGIAVHLRFYFRKLYLTLKSYTLQKWNFGVQYKIQIHTIILQSQDLNFVSTCM